MQTQQHNKIDNKNECKILHLSSSIVAIGISISLKSRVALCTRYELSWCTVGSNEFS